MEYRYKDWKHFVITFAITVCTVCAKLAFYCRHANLLTTDNRRYHFWQKEERYPVFSLTLHRMARVIWLADSLVDSRRKK